MKSPQLPKSSPREGRSRDQEQRPSQSTLSTPNAWAYQSHVNRQLTRRRRRSILGGGGTLGRRLLSSQSSQLLRRVRAQHHQHPRNLVPKTHDPTFKVFSGADRLTFDLELRPASTPHIAQSNFHHKRPHRPASVNNNVTGTSVDQYWLLKVVWRCCGRAEDECHVDDDGAGSQGGGGGGGGIA